MPLTPIERAVLRNTVESLDCKLTQASEDGYPTADLTTTVDLLYEEIDSMTDPHELPERPEDMGALYELFTRTAERAGLDVISVIGAYDAENRSYNLNMSFRVPDGQDLSKIGQETEGESS